MHHRLLARCAIAFAGALTFFTIAIASPALPRFDLRGRPAAGGAADGDAPFALKDGALLFVSISPRATARSTPLLAFENARTARFDDFLDAGRSHCWTSTLVRACVVGMAAR